MEPVRRSTSPRDREQWRRWPARTASSIFWVLSSLMVAEERITTKFSGLVGAHGSEEEATFLATQQVDEARHMQFYARFQDEVVADPAAIAAHVERAREQSSPRLPRRSSTRRSSRPTSGCVADPGDLAAKVRFVTLYHLILEGTLGLTSFHFSPLLEREELLPGFVDGYSKIHHDEQRHIGYGVWFLREAVARRPGHRRGRPRDAARAAARGRRVAARRPARADGDALGVSEDDSASFALDGLTRRLEIIGVPLETVFA